MKNKEIKYSSICGLLLAAVFMIFERSWSLGMLLGILCFALYYLLLSYSINDMTSENPAGGLLVSGGRIIRLIVLTLPMLLSFLFPELINTFAVLMGLLMFKIVTVLLAIFEK